jgi:uncharacterized protein (TIGR02996 family)
MSATQHAEQRRAFIQAIQEPPEDDAPRLVFADWLDENGDEPRAEFIRLQCRLPHLRDDLEFARLRQREQELLEEHRAGWLGPWAGVAPFGLANFLQT